MTVQTHIAIAVLVAAALAGCARLDTVSNPTVSSGGGAAPTASSQRISTSQLDDFIGAEAAAALSNKDRAEAISAQFYALQYGRPGAPRSWQGDSGASGNVSVGPFVRVNELYCRDFSHNVSASSKTYRNSGTACREADGSWKVENS